MATELSVLNDALIQLGQTPVADLTDPSSTAASRKVRAILEAAKDAVLERHGWLAALAYATIEPTTGLDNWKYDAGFELPGDAIRVWTVEGDPCDVAWEFGTVTAGSGAGASTRKIIRASGATSLNVAYVRNLPFSGLTPNLADAVAWEAAYRACGNVTGDMRLAEALRRAAGERLAWAIGVDGMQEGGQDPLSPDPAYSARRSVA